MTSRVKIFARKKMKIKNETEMQLLKILFKTARKKPTKKITSARSYPHGLERKYFRQLQGFFKPLVDYVKKYVEENSEQLLRGDSAEVRLDAIPGKSFRLMIAELEMWIDTYMPDVSEGAKSIDNAIMVSLMKTAEETMDFENKEMVKVLEKGIHVSVPTTSPWWDDMRNSWAADNYNLITSNAKNFVSKINTLTEQAIVNGTGHKKLMEEIQKATTGLSEKHCKLLARDQMGKLNGQITQAQMEEIGLDMYVWSTAFDDRVRDSHALMEGLLCRWDDASVCSYDGGKTWVERPSGAVELHPGQDIQCRCVGLSYYPELTAKVEGKPMEYVPASETEESVSNFETVTDEINSMKSVNGEDDVKNVIPMASKKEIEAAMDIYEKQKKTGTEIYVEKTVGLESVYTMQKLLNRKKLLDFMQYDKTKENGEIIRAVEYGDKFLLLDGNHRVATAILKKGKRLKIAVLNPVEKK